MQLFSIFQLLVASALVSAIPTSGVSSNLSGLDKRASIFAVDCGGTLHPSFKSEPCDKCEIKLIASLTFNKGQTYSREAVQSSYNALVSSYKLAPAQKRKSGKPPIHLGLNY